LATAATSEICAVLRAFFGGEVLRQRGLAQAAHAAEQVELVAGDRRPTV
jgi:hypothetical protein